MSDKRKPIRFRFTDGGSFYAVGFAVGIARPGVLDGRDGKKQECWALPTEIEATDDRGRRVLAFARDVYARDLSAEQFEIEHAAWLKAERERASTTAREGNK